MFMSQCREEVMVKLFSKKCCSINESLLTNWHMIDPVRNCWDFWGSIMVWRNTFRKITTSSYSTHTGKKTFKCQLNKIPNKTNKFKVQPTIDLANTNSRIKKMKDWWAVLSQIIENKKVCKEMTFLEQVNNQTAGSLQNLIRIEIQDFQAINLRDKKELRENCLIMVCR